jgi:hypothetical protein
LFFVFFQKQTDAFQIVAVHVLVPMMLIRKVEICGVLSCKDSTLLTFSIRTEDTLRAESLLALGNPCRVRKIAQ